MIAAPHHPLAAPGLLSPLVHTQRGGVEIIDRLADEWRNLCTEAENDQPFFHPEWIRAYIRAFAPHASLLLITVRVQGRLCLVLPLVEERCRFNGVPLQRLRAPVNAHPGRFDFVCSPGLDGETAVVAAWEHLKKLEGWNLLELRDIPAGGAAGRLAAVARADGFDAVEVPELPNPYIPITHKPEMGKVLPRSSRLRTKLRQARRELVAQGALEFRCVETANKNDLQRFYQLEASGWKGRERSAINSAPSTRKFYDEIAESAARFGYLALYFLEWNGELLAAHFALLYRGRCYSPKVAYNEKFDRFAPGHLIVEEILRDCAARGMKVFDITGPDDEWKVKWTAEARPVSHHYIFKGMLGRLARDVRFRIRPVLGRLLRRKGNNV